MGLLMRTHPQVPAEWLDGYLGNRHPRAPLTAQQAGPCLQDFGIPRLKENFLRPGCPGQTASAEAALPASPVQDQPRSVSPASATSSGPSHLRGVPRAEIRPCPPWTCSDNLPKGEAVCLEGNGAERGSGHLENRAGACFRAKLEREG